VLDAAHARTPQRNGTAAREDFTFSVGPVAMGARLASIATLVTRAFEQIVDLGFEIRLQKLAGFGMAECLKVALEFDAVKLCKATDFRVC
jgi:hypothetical protein